MNREWDALEEKIGYTFQKKELLENALTHSSYAHQMNLPYKKNNERLEFLGDAVLELISSDFIYHTREEDKEGDMTKLRAGLVCERSLAFSAREIGLGAYLKLGKGEDVTGGREKDSLLSDAFEALIGAMYLDGGIRQAEAFIMKWLLSDVEKHRIFYDSKTALQEEVQKEHDRSVQYVLLSESGPDHCKVFRVECRITGKGYGIGEGRSKKVAEQNAAYETLLMLKNEKKQ